MFENIIGFLKKFNKKERKVANNSKEAAKERLHLVLMQDRANVSADFLELMKQEIIDVIKKYIDVDESAIDVRLTNKENADGTNGAPALYANIPILNIKNDARKNNKKEEKQEESGNENTKNKKEEKENIEEKEEKLQQNNEEEKSNKKDKDKEKEKIETKKEKQEEDNDKNTENKKEEKEGKKENKKEKVKTEE